MLADALRELGHEVVQAEPDVATTRDSLKEYENNNVGETTTLSVSANGTYGALSVISHLKDDSRLVLLADAPEHGKIFAGLRAIKRDPKQLFKSFYSRRSGYLAVAGNEEARERILEASLRLSTSRWPKTLWPVLPWHKTASNIVGVPDAARLSLIGLSLDAFYLRQPGVDTLYSERNAAWGVDVPSTKWARSIVHTLGLPHSGIKNKKNMSGSELDERISSLHGVVLTIHDDKRPWWSPLFVKALNAGTPIVTEWKYSQEAGDAWSILAGRIENMSKLDAYELSVHQSRQYLDKIQSKEEVLSTLRQVIDSND